MTGCIQGKEVTQKFLTGFVQISDVAMEASGGSHLHFPHGPFHTSPIFAFHSVLYGPDRYEWRGIGDSNFYRLELTGSVFPVVTLFTSIAVSIKHRCGVCMATLYSKWVTREQHLRAQRAFGPRPACWPAKLRPSSIANKHGRRRRLINRKYSHGINGHQ